MSGKATIDCSAQPFDLSFHPSRENIVAVGLVDGTLEVHDFSPSNISSGDESDDDHDTIVSSIPVHTKKLLSSAKKVKHASCRAVRFSDDGSRLYTGGSGGDICILDADKSCTLSATKSAVLWGLPEAHCPHGIQVLHQLPPEAPTGSVLASGDEEGAVKLWDVRQAQQKPVLSWKENTDYISGLDHSPDGSTLLASSADGTLSVFDLRTTLGQMSKPNDTAVRRSDNQEDELLSVKVIKNGKKVVCGTQEGVLAIWSFGTWGDISDRFPGHPSSIDALLKVDEDTLLTGSSDGVLRLVQIHPDKLLGVLGDHDGYPIEKLNFNASRSVVGSVSHDSFIRLWDAHMLDDDDEEDDSDESVIGDNREEGVASMPVASKRRGTGAGHGSDDQWDSDTDESNGDSSDDNDDHKSMQGNANNRQAKRFKSENEKFFEDL